MALKRVESGRIKVEFLLQSAEEPLPLANASIDTIVMTWTLCSIPDAPMALQQIRRVLKEKGASSFSNTAVLPILLSWLGRSGSTRYGNASPEAAT